MNKRLFLFVGIALLTVLLWSLAGKSTNRSYEEAQEMLQFRRIGHELLLSAGDAKSRVLPVRKISGSEFRIEFEKAFSFTSDSLVAVVNRIVNPGPFPLNYIVNVTEASGHDVVYSFSYPYKGGEVPCAGRPLPAGHYAINILFSDTSSIKSPSASIDLPVILAGLLAAGLLVLAFRFTRNKREVLQNDMTDPVSTDFLSIGKFRFYPGRHLLMLEQQSIGLTAKETKLLNIFSASPNEVIDRNRLLKEGWLDEGVITGRSLDMYVSKLRKKLQADASVSIINVHGKGYRLSC